MLQGPYPTKSLLPLLVALVLSNACRKVSDAPRWDVDILAPLVTTSLTLGDLVADTLLEAAEDGSLTLHYRSELFALDLDTVFNVPDTSLYYRFALPVPGPLNFPPGSSPVVDNQVTQFDFQDVQLRSLILREGWLDLGITNMIASTVIGTFTLPGASLPSGPASLNATALAGSPPNPSPTTVSQDLSGGIFDLRGPSFNSVNSLATNFTAMLDPNGSGATLTNLDSLIAVATYRDLVPQYARGYFGSRTISTGDEENVLGLFDNVVSGLLDVDQVTLRLHVENGIGVDIQARLRYLQAVNTRTNTTIDLTNSIINGPINLNRALDLGNGFQASHYQRSMDNSNSNIDLFLESMPDRVRYAVDMDLNPLGDISNGNDFLYYESRLKADLELIVPLRVIANELTLQTIVTPDLPGSADGHGLRYGDLIVHATNGFPFSARIELAIVDAQGDVMDQLSVTGVIAAGMPGPDGIVQQSIRSRLMTSLNEQQVDLLYNGGRLRIRSIFNTGDATQHVQLYDHYRMDLQITIGANYVVNGDE